MESTNGLILTEAQIADNLGRFLSDADAKKSILTQNDIEIAKMRRYLREMDFDIATLLTEISNNIDVEENIRLMDDIKRQRKILVDYAEQHHIQL